MSESPSEPALPTPAPTLVNVAAAMVILAVLVVSLKTLAGLLQPLLISVFFFYLGRPMARALVRLRVPPALANLAIILVAAGVLAFIAWVVGAHLDDLVSNVPAYNAKLRGLVRSTSDALLRIPRIGDELRAAVFDLGLEDFSIGSAFKGVFGTFVGSLTTIMLVLFYLVFLNSEAATLPRRLEAAYGSERAGRILEVGQRINAGIIGYVYVKFAASLLVAMLCTVTMVIFQVEYALLWGMLIFFGNFIPYVGSFVAVLFPLVVAVLDKSLGAVALLALFLIIWQTLVANLIEPRLAGKAFNLSPILVMFAFAFWGWLWGITGLILAVPIMNAIKLVLENIPATHDLAILFSDAPRRATSGGTPGAPA